MVSTCLTVLTDSKYCFDISSEWTVPSHTLAILSMSAKLVVSASSFHKCSRTLVFWLWFKYRNFTISSLFVKLVISHTIELMIKV